MRDNPKKPFPTKRLRFLARRDVSEEQRQILTEATQATFLPMENIGEQGELNCSLIREIDEIGNGYTQFFEGDVLVAKITPCFENGKGALVHGILNGVGFGTTELHVLRPTEEIDARFLYYSTVSARFRRHGEAAMFGSAGQKRVPEEFVRNFRVWLPPLEQQRAIADYLDRKTERLDGLVAAKKRVLKLLAEKRQALIAWAVTRGIDPDVPHRDSRVPWLGDIPAHWDMGRLKDFGALVAGAGFPHEYQGVRGEDLPFYKVGDLAASQDGRHMGQAPNTVSFETAATLRAQVVPEGAIVYAKIGAALLLNRRRVVTFPCLVDNNMTAYVPNGEALSSDWAFYWTIILDFGVLANPGAVPSLSEGDQAQLPILVPPIAEQRAIAAYLDRETARLDAMAMQIEETVNLLKERRAALIEAAVTGQIDMESAA